MVAGGLGLAVDWPRAQRAPRACPAPRGRNLSPEPRPGTRPRPRHLRRGRGADRSRVPAQPPLPGPPRRPATCAPSSPHRHPRPSCARGRPGPGREGLKGKVPGHERARVPKWEGARAQEVAGPRGYTRRGVRGQGTLRTGREWRRSRTENRSGWVDDLRPGPPKPGSFRSHRGSLQGRQNARWALQGIRHERELIEFTASEATNWCLRT